MTPETQLLLDLLNDATAQALFFAVVLTCFALALLAVMFAVLLLYWFWQWLTRNTWNGAILSAERKLFRR
jgi:hypothetical protein